MKYLTSIIAAAFLLIIVSCTKEKRLENTLTKKDGVWNIDEVTWEAVDQNLSTGAQSVKSATETNVGTFTFEDNNTLTYNYTIDDSLRTGSFGWSVHDDTFSVTAVKLSLFSSYSQSIIAYSGKKTAKTKIEMSGTETYQSTSRQYVLTASFKMTRK